MIPGLFDSVLPKVRRIARDAGAFIRKEREQFSYARVEIKGLNDLVSDVDRQSEELIVKALADLLPEAGFIVEEGTLTGTREYNWIVDPLDGTTNFIHGIPCYAVSIALEHKGKIILGVVYEVSRDECYSAVAGHGATMNERTIHVSHRTVLTQSLIATGFPIYNFTRLSEYLVALEHLLRSTYGVRRIGAASADLCYLACGRVEGFFEYNLHPWDVAAGGLIVKEAGGMVSDFAGGDQWLYGREICAANPHVFRDFLEVVSGAFKTT